MKPKARSAEKCSVSLCALLSLGLVLFSGIRVHAELYSLNDIGVLAGSSIATGINESGLVVGNNPGSSAFFMYAPDNGVIGPTLLSVLPPLGGHTVSVTGVNDSAQIVGSSATFSIYDNGPTQAFVYSAPTGTTTNLSSPGWLSSSANAINNSGQVVGTYATSTSGEAQGFLYNNGVVTNLGSLGGSQTVPMGINGVGQVVGYSYTTGNAAQVAFLYSNGTMTNLGTLGGAASSASAINDAGQVVGGSGTSSGGGQAFLYSNGTMKGLGTLGGNAAQAFGINNLGQIVGESTTAGNGGPHAFLYSNGSMLDLNNLLAANGSGLTLVEAAAINDNGQIVGWGVNSLGQTRAYLLTPVPVPGAALLFGSGLLTILGWRSRARFPMA